MTLCQECNSEIAEVEAFCPFCGIAIAPTDSAGAVEDSIEEIEVGAEVESSVLSKLESETDAMAETVVGTPAEMLENTKDDGGFVDISALKDESEDDEAEDIENEDKDADESAIDKSSDDDLDVDDSEKISDSEIEDAVSEIDRKVDLWQDKFKDEVGADSPIEPKDLKAAASDEDVADAQPEASKPSAKSSVDLTDAGSLESAGIKDDVSVAAAKASSAEVESDSSKEKEEKSNGDEPDVVEVTSSAIVYTEEEGAVSDGSASKAVAAEVEVETKEESSGFEESAAELETASDDKERDSSDKPDTAEPVPKDETPAIVTDSDIESIDITQSSIIVDPPADVTSEPVVEDAADAASIDIETKETADAEGTVETDSPTPDEPKSPDAIVQSDEPAKDETSAEVEESESTPIEATVEGVTDDVVITENDEESDSVVDSDENPGTSPNIGGGDTDGSNTPKLRPLDEGTVLNSRYEIVRKIGGGGMGAVYLASDKNLGGVLRAVKEMVQSYIEKEQQEKAIQDFKRESMLLTSLEHAAIPTIYDYFFDDQEGRFYLVMKYISGGDLSARLRAAPEGRLDEISVTQWALEISDVLVYLHNRKPPIVYRDLKPANIMIDGNSSRIMLIDFGIARWVNKEEKGVTAVGTMGYAPPELFSGNVVPSSDIYSLGSTMFHLLTGADPQNNPLLIFDFQKHPRPRQINPNLSDQMERILMRTVEYNADGRFSSAEELRNELDQHLANLKTGRVSYGIKESPAAVALSDQPVFCGFCGQKIVATDMFCAFCGAKQPLAQPGVQSQEYSIPQVTAKLYVEGTGDLNVPTFDLGKRENLVGRRDPMSNIFPEVDLSKFDPQTKVSRKHARIYREGEKFLLEDLGSSNGTIVNQPGVDDPRRLAPHQTHSLSNGDRIQLGDTVLHFVVGQQ